MQRHRKAVHKRRAVRHGVAKRRAPAERHEEDASRAAENRGYDLYDLVDYGYDLSKGVIDDMPPEPDDDDLGSYVPIDAYSPS